MTKRLESGKINALSRQTLERIMTDHTDTGIPISVLILVMIINTDSTLLTGL